MLAYQWVFDCLRCLLATTGLGKHFSDLMFVDVCVLQLTACFKMRAAMENAQLWHQRLTVHQQVMHKCVVDDRFAFARSSVQWQRQPFLYVVFVQMTAAMAMFAMLLMSATYQSSPSDTAMRQVGLCHRLPPLFQTEGAA